MTATVWSTSFPPEVWEEAGAHDDYREAHRVLVAAEAEVEARKEAAEAAFREALATGHVLVEHWLVGVEPYHTVWTGREYAGRADGYDAAAHVANRFRAGWTRVEIRPAE